MRARRNHTRKVHSGRVFELHVDNVTLENGVTVDMDVIRHPGAAAIVPLTAQGGVLLIRQYRDAKTIAALLLVAKTPFLKADAMPV